jgi:hypothetical protein
MTPLQRYYATFPARTRAVQREVAKIVAAPPTPIRRRWPINDGETYEVGAWLPLRDGMEDPGT